MHVFPVADAPVDRRARHRRLLLDELANPREVAVRRADRVFHDGRILLRQGVGSRDRVRQRRRLSPGPGRERADPKFTFVTLLLGIATVWLYAAIRPRLGPGPKTAIVAGVFVWALSYLYASIFFYMLGTQSLGLVVLGVVWSGVEMIIASSVGAYLYKEA
ncbi:MAG: hypothetical protein K2Y23_03095 [Cyanobacteria bacterium]|nr:hypothetical protein [Cyanobacteriota bacterium]